MISISESDSVLLSRAKIKWLLENVRILRVKKLQLYAVKQCLDTEKKKIKQNS